MKKLHIKKDDVVVVNSGDDRGSKAKVLAVSPEEGKVIVEGLNMVKKHVKPRKMGDPGGIIEAEGAIYACKVMVVCPHCKKPTRVAHKVTIAENGKAVKTRVCKHCGETL